jgi:hypothetical protein
MGDAHFRHDGAPLRNDPQHFDRPAFRIAAVELHEICAAAEPDQVVRPFEDEAVSEQVAHADPIPRLNSAPKLGDNFARFHGPIIRPQGTFPNTGSAGAPLALAGDVDDAEAVALGVGEDDVVGIGRSFVPMNLGRAERQQPLDLRSLIFGVEVEVEAWRDLQSRANLIEREVRTRAVGGREKDEVVAVAVVATDKAESRLPELRLTLQIIDAQNDRADAEHR